MLSSRIATFVGERVTGIAGSTQCRISKSNYLAAGILRHRSTTNTLASINVSWNQPFTNVRWKQCCGNNCPSWRKIIWASTKVDFFTIEVPMLENFLLLHSTRKKCDENQQRFTLIWFYVCLRFGLCKKMSYSFFILVFSCIVVPSYTARWSESEFNFFMQWLRHPCCKFEA